MRDEEGLEVNDVASRETQGAADQAKGQDAEANESNKKRKGTQAVDHQSEIVQGTRWAARDDPPVSDQRAKNGGRAYSSEVERTTAPGRA